MEGKNAQGKCIREEREEEEEEEEVEGEEETDLGNNDC